MPDLPRSQATRQQGPRRSRRGGLLVKFLLILMPLFLMLAGPGIGFLVHYALDEDKEALAVRFGNHAGRVASAIARHDPIADPEIAQDLIATLGADPALICAELRNDPDGRVLASQPPRIGCRGREEGLLLAIPVGDAGAYTLAIRFSDAEMREEQRLTIAVSLSVIALAFLLAVVASTIGFRIIVGQPLKLLLRAIELSAATGERRAVGVGRHDELGSVIQAFDAMQARDVERERALQSANEQLQASQAELKCLNQDLERAVRERTAELEAQKIKAESANRSKSQFLASMSHELRTPLNSIIGFSAIMRQQDLGPLGNERYVDFASHIHAGGEHLLQIINDILDLAKIEAGSMTLEEEDVPADAIVEDCLRLVRPMAAARGIGLGSRAEAGDALLRVDLTKIKQVLINLLANAIKFTPQGGSVELSVARETDGGVAFVVADTGIGMSPGDIPVALSAFGQIDASLARSYEGTGLGLPLAKQLTELHGGALDVDSALGQGIRVTVRLPASRIAAPVGVAQAGRSRR